MHNFRECCFKSFPSDGKRLIWEITHKCGFNCEYCFQEKKRQGNPIRSINERDLIKICEDKIPALEIKDVLITGGEIYNIRDMLPSVTEALKSNSLPYSFSSAQIYDNSFVSLLLSLKPKALNISLDPGKNNSNGKFLKELNSVETVLKQAEILEVPVKITGIINKSNIIKTEEYLNTINKLADKYNSFSSAYITNPYDIGYIKSDRNLTEKECTEVLKIASKYPNNKFSYVNFPRFNLTLQGCYAGSKYIHLEPDGNVYPCHLFANLSKDIYLMGNLFLDSISTINRNLDFFAKQSKDAMLDYKKQNSTCTSCSKKSKCGAGCLAEIISRGDFIEPVVICKKLSPPKKKKSYKVSSQFITNLENEKNDISSYEEDEIIKYIKSSIAKGQIEHDLAHGYDHIICVVRLARFIAKNENANLRIVTAAAYFHDFAPRQNLIFESHTRLSAQSAVDYLTDIGFNESDLQQIYDCIDSSSYGSDELGIKPQSLEAMIVRDADWLDAIGSRGIARVFAFGSAHGCETLGEVEWDPENPPIRKMSLFGPDPSPIYHFFSKLLRVYEKLSTATGRQIGKNRHQRLVNFLKDYKKEMEEETFLE